MSLDFILGSLFGFGSFILTMCVVSFLTSNHVYNYTDLLQKFRANLDKDQLK